MRINEFLTGLQRVRHIRVNPALHNQSGNIAKASRQFKFQAIERDGTTGNPSSCGRRPCEALSSSRTRIAGTGRLNK